MTKPRTAKKKLAAAAAAAILVIAVILALVMIRRNRRVDMPMPYNAQEFGYDQSAQTLIYTDAAFATGLCIGENDVGNENVTIASGEHAGLFSLDDGKVVFAKGMYEKIYPASVTKIMTAIVALRYGNLNDMVTINWQDLELESGSQVVGFKIGDRVSMRELMYGLLIHSGNDAAMAIARAVGGSAEKFVVMMNEEAERIGATSTHFVNPSGLHDDEHYTTVYDIYLMLREAMNYDFFVNAMQISVYDLMCHDEEGNEKHVTLDSTDHYLTGQANPPKDVTVLGGKTGTTNEARSCLALASQNAYGQPYISIIMGAPDKETLYTDMNTLLAQINS